MRISCAGTIAVAAYNWIAFILRSLGDSRTPLIFLVVSSVLNVALDLLFVIPLGMGINGAALATVLSQGVSAVASIIFAFAKNRFFRFSAEHTRLDRAICGKCVKTGVPIALQNAMISVSMISLQKTANGFGKNVMAAYTASMRVEQLIQQPYASLGSAMATFTGQNYGAGKNERISRCYRRCTLLVLGFSLVMTALFLIFSEGIAGFFRKPPRSYRDSGERSADKLPFLLLPRHDTPHPRSAQRYRRRKLRADKRALRGSGQDRLFAAAGKSPSDRLHFGMGDHGAYMAHHHAALRSAVLHLAQQQAFGVTKLPDR